MPQEKNPRIKKFTNFQLQKEGLKENNLTGNFFKVTT
jgi:hypothetical protein